MWLSTHSGGHRDGSKANDAVQQKAQGVVLYRLAPEMHYLPGQGHRETGSHYSVADRKAAGMIGQEPGFREYISSVK